MSDIRMTFDVKGQTIISQIEKAIEDGMRDGGAALAEEGKEIAEERIRTVGAIFTGDLVESFEIDIEKRGDHLFVTLENTSDHAAPIEYGAQYGPRGPPVAALIPWVKLKMRGYTVPEDELEDLPDPEDVEEDTTIPMGEGPALDLTNIADEEIVQKAFWLQQHIKEEGIDAVRYMEMAEEFVEADADNIVADAIEAELR